MKNSEIITEDELEMMQVIHKNPYSSQRDLAKKTGFSIGKINYCIKSLIEIGFIKINNFRNSNNKLNYAYILTPKGIYEKTVITNKFIAKKQQEYDKLMSYIDKK